MALDEEWEKTRRAGLCAARTDTYRWFPDSPSDPSIPFVKRICNKCPIKTPCYAYGYTHKEFGIWGGTTEWERGMHHVFLGDVGIDVLIAKVEASNAAVETGSLRPDQLHNAVALTTGSELDPNEALVFTFTISPPVVSPDLDDAASDPIFVFDV